MNHHLLYTHSVMSVAIVIYIIIIFVVANEAVVGKGLISGCLVDCIYGRYTYISRATVWCVADSMIC